MAGRATDTSTGVAGSRDGVTRDGPAEEVIRVVEENLAVGKRDVRGGSVRVRTHVVETPVEEDVRRSATMAAIRSAPTRGSRRSWTQSVSWQAPLLRCVHASAAPIVAPRRG
jgi:hypothetical protein